MMHLHLMVVRTGVAVIQSHGRRSAGGRTVVGVLNAATWTRRHRLHPVVARTGVTLERVRQFR